MSGFDRMPGYGLVGGAPMPPDPRIAAAIAALGANLLPGSGIAIRPEVYEHWDSLKRLGEGRARSQGLIPPKTTERHGIVNQQKAPSYGIVGSDADPFQLR